MDKQFIRDLVPNQKIEACFALNKKELKRTKYDKPYLEITLVDKTGRIEGRLWDEAEKFDKAAGTGDIVRIKGSVVEFRDEKQIKVDFMEKADEEIFEQEDMARVVGNREELMGKVRSFLEDLSNPWIKALSGKFTGDGEFMGRFYEGAGAKSWHNAYIGGLLEHTYEVMFITDQVCSLYPEADRDIAVFGAFLHDLGKVFEIDVKKMDYTVAGGLLGHIAIGYKMLNSKISEIEDFPEDISCALEHIILSHHGEYEQQSPVLPKTLEATIVYQVDELVSQANAVKEIKTQQSGEGRAWSNYVSIKNRKYFLGKVDKEDGAKAMEAPDDDDLFG